jgi:hypothetical protein
MNQSSTASDGVLPPEEGSTRYYSGFEILRLTVAIYILFLATRAVRALERIADRYQQKYYGAEETLTLTLSKWLADNHAP